MQMHSRRRLLIWLLLLPLLGGCGEIGYYWQAGWGQLEILAARRPITEVLDDATVPDETKRKLRMVLAVQTFATRELALPPKGHYTTYVQLDRAYASWLVVAAPEFSVEAHRFCYLIVGCLGYRGYFAEEDAEALAAELRAEGLDAIVRPVRAYSTLGWFDDPVLNSFLGGDDTYVLGTIIHEQTHARYFLSGETDFNESYAEFVEEQGLERFLRGGEYAQPELLERARRIRGDQARFREIVLRGRERLAELYASDLPPEEKRSRKPALFDALREDYQKHRASFRLLNYDSWFAQPLNNAHLVGVAQYARHIGAFRALYVESGRDFARFHAAVEALGELPADQRAARLDELEQSALAHAESTAP